MGFACLAEVPVAIVGIARAVRPLGQFKIVPSIISSVFIGGFGLLLLLGVIQQFGITENSASLVLIPLGFLAVMALLIVGTVRGAKEKTSTPFLVHDANKPQPIPFANVDSPLSVASSKSELDQPSLTPLTGKAAEEMAKLQKLYEYKLISEKEYAEKKRKILEPFQQKEPLSPEKARMTSDLSALWKLYEQHLITEEEYLTQRNAILARSNIK